MKYIIVTPIVLLIRIILSIYVIGFTWVYKLLYLIWYFKPYVTKQDDHSYSVHLYDNINKGHLLNKWPYKLMRQRRTDTETPYQLRWKSDLDYIWGKEPDELSY